MDVLKNSYFRAQMAELVDAQGSGLCDRKVVKVRVFFWAPFIFRSYPCATTQE